MKLKYVISSVLLATGVAMAFQNCGNPGAIETKVAETGSPGQPVLNNSLEVGAPVNDDGETTTGTTPPGEEPQVPDIPENPNEPPKYTFNDVVHEGKCANIEVSDVLLNVAKVEVALSSSAALEINDLNTSISVADNSIKMKALAAGSVSEIRLILNEGGNYLLSFDELVYGLKTPSGQTSGFKIKLPTPVQVTEGEDYVLALNMDLNRQIVVAGSKCLMKPVIRSSTLTPL